MPTTTRQSPVSQNAGPHPLMDTATLWICLISSILIGSVLLEIGLIFIGTGVAMIAVLILCVIFLQYLNQ